MVRSLPSFSISSTTFARGPFGLKILRVCTSNLVPRVSRSMGPVSLPRLHHSDKTFLLFLFFSVFTGNDFNSLSLRFNRTGICWQAYNASVISILNLLFSWTWLAAFVGNLQDLELEFGTSQTSSKWFVYVTWDARIQRIYPLNNNSGVFAHVSLPLNL
jgi:hypothetical protein